MRNDIDSMLKLVVINQGSVPHLLHMCSSHWITLISCNWQTGQSEHCTLQWVVVGASLEPLSVSSSLFNFLHSKERHSNHVWDCVFVRDQARRDICFLHGIFFLLNLWKYSLKSGITNIILNLIHQLLALCISAIQFTETSISCWRFYVWI